MVAWVGIAISIAELPSSLSPLSGDQVAARLTWLSPFSPPVRKRRKESPSEVSIAALPSLIESEITGTPRASPAAGSHSAASATPSLNCVISMRLVPAWPSSTIGVAPSPASSAASRLSLASPDGGLTARRPSGRIVVSMPASKRPAVVIRSDQGGSSASVCAVSMVAAWRTRSARPGGLRLGSTARRKAQASRIAGRPGAVIRVTSRSGWSTKRLSRVSSSMPSKPGVPQPNRSPRCWRGSLTSAMRRSSRSSRRAKGGATGLLGRPGSGTSSSTPVSAKAGTSAGALLSIHSTSSKLTSRVGSFVIAASICAR